MLEAWLAISWVGVLAASVASFLLGGVWFALLWAQPYARALGREGGPLPPPTRLFLLGPMGCGLVMSITSALLQGLLHTSTPGAAATLGAVVGLGYLGATATNVAINPNMPRPLLYALVNVPYFVLSSISIHLIVFSLQRM